MTKSLLRGLLPLLTGIAVLAAAGLLVPLYRSTWTAGPGIEPRIPRAQTTFSVRLPALPSGGPDHRSLLLRAIKESSDPLSVGYWPSGRTVFQMPVAIAPPDPGKPPASVRLVLWDPGRYQITFSDPTTQRLVETLPVHVVAPLTLYRNDVLLLLLLGGAGYLSGRFVRLPAPEGQKKGGSAPSFIRHRSAVATAALLAGLLLVLMERPLPAPRTPLPSLSGGPGGTYESEGRKDAARMPIPLSLGPGQSPEGFLVLRHRLDSWVAYGHDLTLFSGPVDLRLGSRAYLLPPDDGRYRLTLWTSDGTGRLLPLRQVARALPVSPAFPLGLFLGFSLFSLAFFFLGATPPAVRVSRTPLERFR